MVSLFSKAASLFTNTSAKADKNTDPSIAANTDANTRANTHADTHPNTHPNKITIRSGRIQWPDTLDDAVRNDDAFYRATNIIHFERVIVIVPKDKAGQISYSDQSTELVDSAKPDCETLVGGLKETPCHFYTNVPSLPWDRSVHRELAMLTNSCLDHPDMSLRDLKSHIKMINLNDTCAGFTSIIKVVSISPDHAKTLLEHRAIVDMTEPNSLWRPSEMSLRDQERYPSVVGVCALSNSKMGAVCSNKDKESVLWCLNKSKGNYNRRLVEQGLKWTSEVPGRETVTVERAVTDMVKGYGGHMRCELRYVELTKEEHDRLVEEEVIEPLTMDELRPESGPVHGLPYYA
jgi:hypothetical protein